MSEKTSGKRKTEITQLVLRQIVENTFLIFTES